MTISINSDINDKHDDCEHHASLSWWIRWLISPPTQRQRWTDKQILPHVNWGDLFFDLFYVSAAYNLGNVLKYDPTWEGVLYFVGCFIQIKVNFWGEKMLYDSKFEAGDDVIHRGWEVLQLTFLATAVLNIQTVEKMSNMKNTYMFNFLLFNLLGIFMSMLRYIEIAFVWVNGEKAAKKQAISILQIQSVSFIFTGIATVYSGILRFGNGDRDEDHRLRFLGESSTNVSHVPIIIAASMIVIQPILMVTILICFQKSDFKSYTVPMNIDFAIHRYGEWSMLMLGESILSLLIVETSKDWQYTVIFYAGVVSVILLQYLHFKSQPHHAKDHAMRKSRSRGLLWYSCSNFYSLALIAVGVSFKMFLTEYTDTFDSNYKIRNLNSLDSHLQPLPVQNFERFLASGGGGELYKLLPEERQKRITIIFAIGMALIWLLQDVMILTHQGISTNLKRCHTVEERPQMMTGAAFLIVSRMFLIAFTASLPWFSFIASPVSVVVIGLVLIVAQVFLRVAGNSLFQPSTQSLKTHQHDDEGDNIKDDEGDNFDNGEGNNFEDDEKWPNETQPRSDKASWQHQL